MTREIKRISLANLFWFGWLLAFLFIVLYADCGISGFHYKVTAFSFILAVAGLFIVTYSHYCFRRNGGLVTCGIYRFTRHPIYHGFFLADLSYWLRLPSISDAAWLFYIAQAIFVACLVACAYFEEREVLEKYGNAAVEYYKSTPRLIIQYPLVFLCSYRKDK